MSKDPRKMKLTEKCYTCFNSNVAVKCSGDLVRYKPGSETEWWITADKCIEAGGNCCKKSDTYIFNPNYIKDPNCNDCYSGELSSTSIGCGGTLVASNNYTASTCQALGGSCCDESPSGI